MLSKFHLFSSNPFYCKIIENIYLMGVGHFAKLHFARLHFANFFESMWRIKKMWHFAKLQFAKLKIIK